VPLSRQTLFTQKETKISDFPFVFMVRADFTIFSFTDVSFWIGGLSLSSFSVRLGNKDTMNDLLNLRFKIMSECF